MPKLNPELISITTVKKLNHPEVQKITGRGLTASPKIEQAVKKILVDIQKNGHAAVLKYAKNFDGLKGNLRLSKAKIAAQAGKCPGDVQKAIKTSIKNVRAFHKKQQEQSWAFKDVYGNILGQRIHPLSRVGLYVPGGAGVYPSSVIMNAVPAQVAGVAEIVAVTPVKGQLHPAVAFALFQLGIEEVYQIGGAQAVGMLAFGSSKVKAVDKIVGPGNSYVAYAKKEVFGYVDIDMVAGPSEILILADDSADPDWVAADLLSQAEHGSGDEAAILITTSKNFALMVRECLAQQVENSPKSSILKKSLHKFGKIFVVPDLKFGCELANTVAPEHMELMVRQSQKWVPLLKNIGALFEGPYSSEPIGDYIAGPNHVLPTSGSARFYSPLGVYDFYKRSSYIRYSQAGFKKVARQVVDLAEAEGFIHHADAVKRRM